ncbi:Uncharacterised protein, partial [Amycolatopsis camponoti]
NMLPVIRKSLPMLPHFFQSCFWEQKQQILALLQQI